MNDTAAEKRALNRRWTYVRGRLREIKQERARLKEEIRDAIAALKTATDSADKKARRFRVSYLRQRAPLLTQESVALSAEHKTLLTKVREKRDAKAAPEKSEEEE